jgi:hypothetical protein
LAYETVVEFDHISPFEGQDPKLAKDAPFTLEILYYSKQASSTDNCKSIEIHFVVEPIK